MKKLLFLAASIATSVALALAYATPPDHAEKKAGKAVKIEQVTEPVTFGEGPHWSALQKCLYFVDIDAGIILKYNTTDEILSRIYVPPGGNPVSFVIPSAEDENELVISRKREVLLIRVDNFNIATIVRSVATVEPTKPNNRFNEARADSRGRLWAGTVGPEGPNGEIPSGGEGSLYRLNNDSSFFKADSGIDISNGITWSLDDRKLFYIDTGTLRVDVFDYDIDTAIASNRRPLYDFAANNITGAPDSMSIDSEGKLWVACYAGSQVIRIDPETSQLLQSVQLPVTLVTSAVWGGENLEILYVTSSRHGLTDEDLALQPLAGSTFKISGLGVVGTLANNVKLPLPI